MHRQKRLSYLQFQWMGLRFSRALHTVFFVVCSRRGSRAGGPCYSLLVPFISKCVKCDLAMIVQFLCQTINYVQLRSNTVILYRETVDIVL